MKYTLHSLPNQKLYCRRTNYNNYYSATFDEIKDVTSRERIRKYFPKESVNELIELLEIIGEHIEITPIHFINRDPKDNFLLDLIDFSKANFLVTGDKDLLENNPFKTATILTPANFAAGKYGTKVGI